MDQNGDLRTLLSDWEQQDLVCFDQTLDDLFKNRVEYPYEFLFSDVFNYRFELRKIFPSYKDSRDKWEKEYRIFQQFFLSLSNQIPKEFRSQLFNDFSQKLFLIYPTRILFEIIDLKGGEIDPTCTLEKLAAFCHKMYERIKNLIKDLDRTFKTNLRRTFWEKPNSHPLQPLVNTFLDRNLRNSKAHENYDFHKAESGEYEISIRGISYSKEELKRKAVQAMVFWDILELSYYQAFMRTEGMILYPDFKIYAFQLIAELSKSDSGIYQHFEKYLNEKVESELEIISKIRESGPNEDILEEMRKNPFIPLSATDANIPESVESFVDRAIKGPRIRAAIKKYYDKLDEDI